jgi:alkylated DNA repair dioxygenase AlkB
MIPRTPIAMISLSQTRTFLLRRCKGDEKVELPIASGAVVRIPYETKLRWVHQLKRPSRRPFGKARSLGRTRAFGFP